MAKRPTAPVDLLWDRGPDLTGKSVVQGRERLEEIITPVDGIQVGGYLEKRGAALSSLRRKKDSKALSQSGRPVFTDQENAHPDCSKNKSRPEQEFAVCGFTEGKASRKHFGALLLGAYRNGKLCYFGLFGQRV
jgi:bifunctional non-homologous end joining protein LigD